jgi:thioredoxin-like negative regulator of GroEL
MKRLIYYSAEWCQPCKTLGPIMDQVSQTIPLEKINIDYELNRAQSAKVSSIPTVILVENNQEVRRFVGAKSYQQVIDFING